MQRFRGESVKEIERCGMAGVVLRCLLQAFLRRRLRPVVLAELRIPVAGFLGEVFLEEGDAVSRGDQCALASAQPGEPQHPETGADP